MIVGIGCDLVEVARIACSLERRREAFCRRVFSAAEAAYCDARKTPALHYAARWAAKEAFLKAIKTGWAQGVGWKEIEVRNRDNGAPELVLHGTAAAIAKRQGAANIQVSLSHTAGMAMAVVVIEREGKVED